MVCTERTLGYHSSVIEILTSSRKPDERQCQADSLTGAVASERVTEAPKGTLRMDGNHSKRAKSEEMCIRDRTNIYLYYDNTDYGPRVPLDYTCSTHPDAFVFNIYDDQKQLNCLVLSIPSAEIDLTAHTLPVQDLENNQLITIDLQTGIAT